MHCFRRVLPIVVVLAGSVIAAPVTAQVFGFASEWTQILNNLELVGIAGQSATQIDNQLTQIGQLAQQIQNQLQIYQNMLQNTQRLPTEVWGEIARDLDQLRDVVNRGDAIAFSMGDIDAQLKQRFASFAEFSAGVETGRDFASNYRDWSNTNRDTIAATLRTAGLTSDQLSGEEATLDQLKTMSQTSVGQMQALQVGHQIATQQVEQTQKLRALISQQIAMTGTWYQSEQAAKDLAQARRDAFFSSRPYPFGHGQKMEPRW